MWVTSGTLIFRVHRPIWLSLPTGKHIMLSANIDQDNVMRAYTPVPDQQDTQHVDLLISKFTDEELDPNSLLVEKYSCVRIRCWSVSTLMPWDPL